MRGVETMAEGLVTSQRLGLEVILQILRLEGHFCGDHVASTPPPSFRIKPENLRSQTIHIRHMSLSDLKTIISHRNLRISGLLKI